MEKITADRIALLHPSLRDEVTRLVDQCNAALTGTAQMRITQGFRSFASQDELYAQGRTNKKAPKVTAARGGESYHNYGLAIDFVLVLNGKEISWNTGKDFDGDQLADWEEVIKIFEAAGWKSGRSFKDLPHLEKSPVHWKVLLQKYKAGAFIPGTNYVIL